MHLNRTESINISKLKIPKLNFSELWLFGAADFKQEKWHLFGNLLKDPNHYEFEHPKT